MNRVKTFVGLLSIVMTLIVQAQVDISGKIQDSNGEPLIGATVREQNTTNGAITDIDGNFRLQVSSDQAVLEISSVGFLTIVQRVGTQTNFTFTLEEDVEELEEVVITALGFRANKDNIGYANSKVSEEAIKKAAEPTLLNSLSGKSSGVRITRNSSDPGAGAYIQIRGSSTITRDGQPLIVVDGVPISNDNRGTAQIAQQSRLNDLNPNDIEDITILKGASAAALWGTKALGGAIIITTKTGKYNQPLKVSIKSSYSIDQINRKYPLQDRFGQGNNGVYSPTARDSWGDRIADRSGEPDEFNTSGEFFVDQNGVTHYPILGKNSRQTFNDSNFDNVFQTATFLKTRSVLRLAMKMGMCTSV